MAPSQQNHKKQKRPRSNINKFEASSQVNGAETLEIEMQDVSDSDSDDSDASLTFAEANYEESDSDSESDDNMDGTHEANGKSNTKTENVNVEFVFTDPKEDHFHSVKQYLMSYLPPSHPCDVSGLADLIVNQVSAGTMVCIEGENDAYGFITVLNIKQHQEAKSIQQILQYIRKNCSDRDTLEQLNSILQTKSVGLVINERMINLPYQLVPALHSALHEDIEWAIENESTEELKKSFQFDYFLLLCSCSMEKQVGGRKSSKKKVKVTYEEASMFFDKFEDEYAQQEAEVTFTFQPPVSSLDVTNSPNKRNAVVLIERQRHKNILTTLNAMLNV